MLYLQKNVSAVATPDKMINNLNLTKKETETKSLSTSDSGFVQFTKLQVYFIMNGIINRVQLMIVFYILKFLELTIDLMDQEYSYSECKQTALFTANSLEIEFAQKTFTMIASVRLKSMEMCQFIPEKIQMLHTRTLDESNTHLINIEFMHVS